MGLKKKKRREKRLTSRTKGQARALQVLDIVATDCTFKLVEGSWVGKCLHCNAALVVSTQGTTSATVEHIIPVSCGGTGEIENLALACSHCNSEKGVRHDPNYPHDKRAREVIEALSVKRMKRWRGPQPT